MHWSGPSVMWRVFERAILPMVTSDLCNSDRSATMYAMADIGLPPTSAIMWSWLLRRTQFMSTMKEHTGPCALFPTIYCALIHPAQSMVRKYWSPLLPSRRPARSGWVEDGIGSLLLALPVPRDARSVRGQHAMRALRAGAASLFPSLIITPMDAVTPRRRRVGERWRALLHAQTALDMPQKPSYTGYSIRSRV